MNKKVNRGIASWGPGKWLVAVAGGSLIWLAVVIGGWSLIVWGVMAVLGIEL